MRYSILKCFTLAVFVAQLSVPAFGANLSNIRPNTHQTATVAIEHPTHFAADAEGTISFENLASRLRSDNLNILSISSKFNSQKAFNRDQAHEDLVDAINGQTDLIWALESTENADKSQIAAMKASVATMHDQLELLDKEDYDDMMGILSEQTEYFIHQTIIGSENLYFTILTYELTLDDLTRSLAQLDDTVDKMELRYELGLISSMTLSEIKASYASLQSQAAELKTALSSMKATLASMLGLAPNSTLTFKSLPAISAAQMDIANIDYDKALELAKSESFVLYQAKETLEDAEEQWKDDKHDFTIGTSKYEKAYQTYQAAMYTYESKVSDFTLSFYNLYESIPSLQVKVDAKRLTAKTKEQSYQVAKLNHASGRLSDSALLTSKNDMKSAQSALKSMEIKHFTAYRQYEQAVNWGIINAASPAE